MAELTYRDAVARGIAQEMERDERVVFLGEDVAKAGGVFKATVGLYEKFGPLRVRDTPISEQAILGAAMGAAMTGLRPIAEIMFSDFLAVCFDYVANEMSKLSYMTNGQLSCPLVIRTGNGGGVRFGAQHSQSIENWTMMIPGVKVVAPSSPVDVIGLMAAAVRDPNPVIFHEHKALYAMKGEVPDGEIVDTLGTAKILRAGRDCTIVALALMVPRALEAAEILQREHGIDAEVIDVRSLVPLDTQTILGSVAKTGRLFTVEENPRLCGWGAEIASIVADESFLGSRRSDRPHHHAAHPPARRRPSRGSCACRARRASSTRSRRVMNGIDPWPTRSSCRNSAKRLRRERSSPGSSRSATRSRKATTCSRSRPTRSRSKSRRSSAGRLSEIRVGAGEIAKVGAMVAVDRRRVTGEAAPTAEAVDAKAALDGSRVARPFEEVSTANQVRFGPAKGPRRRCAITPLARRLIAQNDLDIAAARDGSQATRRQEDRRAAVRAAIASRDPPTPRRVAPAPDARR